MIHTKDKDVATRTEALVRAFGWQGGTIHQIAEETGCDAHDLIYAVANEYSLDWGLGWFAYRTNSLEFNQENITPKQQRNLQFWLGVAAGVQTSLKMKQETPKKF